MPRQAEPDDIELELDHLGPSAQGGSARSAASTAAAAPAAITERRPRRALIAGATLAVAAAITVSVLATGDSTVPPSTGVSPSTGASPSTSGATPTTAAATSGATPTPPWRTMLDDDRVAALLGDKLVVVDPSAADTDLVGLIALDHTAPRPLWVSGRWIVAQGTGLDDDPRTGTWAFDATGVAAPRFLGATTGFAPAVDRSGGLWLLGGSSVTRTTLDGTVTAGPFEAPAPVVAAAGDGLVLDDAGLLSLWVPGTGPGDAQPIGSGRLLDANDGQILWASAAGHVTVTTTTTLTNSAVLRLAETIVAGWLAPGGAHAGVATGTAVWVGPVRAALGEGWVSVDTPQPALAWATDQVALVADGTGGVVSVRPRSGSTGEALQLPTAATAIAVIDEVEWRAPVVAEHPDAGEIRADFLGRSEDVCFSRSVGRLENSFVCWKTDPSAAFQGQRTITGLVVGIARDPTITSVRIETPTGPALTVPVTAQGQPFPVGVFASPIADEPGPLRLVALDREGNEVATTAA